MRRVLLLLFSLILFISTAFAQARDTFTMAVTSSSSSHAVTSSYSTVFIKNTGTKTAYIRFGGTAVTTDLPVLAGSQMFLSMSPWMGTIAAITSGSDTTNLEITSGFTSEDPHFLLENASTSSLSVTAASSRVSFAGNGSSIMVQNSGSNSVFVKLGTVTVTAAITDLELKPGGRYLFVKGDQTHIAAICAPTKTSTLLVTSGYNTNYPTDATSLSSRVFYNNTQTDIIFNPRDGVSSGVLRIAGGIGADGAYGSYIKLTGNENADYGALWLYGGRGDGTASHPPSVNIFNGTVDNSDTGTVSISPAGGLGSSRGPSITMFGNEHATNPSRMKLSTGEGGGGKFPYIDLTSEGLDAFRFTADGSHLDFIHDFSNVGGYDVKFRASTVDGSDSNALFLTAGGAVIDPTRSASVTMYGNEYSTSNKGKLFLLSGDYSAAGVEVSARGSAGSVNINTRGGDILFAPNNLDTWAIKAGGTLEQNGTNGSDIVFNKAATGIRQGTSDGSDTLATFLTGGGSLTSVTDRGAYLALYGNENANKGSLLLQTGKGDGSTVNSPYASLGAGTADGYDLGYAELFGGGSNGSDRGAVLQVFGNESGEKGLAKLTSGKGAGTLGNVGGVKIFVGTDDDADYGSVELTASAVLHYDRSAYLKLFGNENATAGYAILESGTAADSRIQLNSMANTGGINFGVGNTAGTIKTRWSVIDTGDFYQNATDGGDLVLNKVGTGFKVKEGSNARMGTFNCVNPLADIVVSNTSVTANTRIFLSCQAGTMSFCVPRVKSRIAGTSFTADCQFAGTDTVAYLLVEPS